MNNTFKAPWQVEVEESIIAYLTGGCASYSDIRSYLSANYDLTPATVQSVLRGMVLEALITKRTSGLYFVRPAVK